MDSNRLANLSKSYQDKISTDLHSKGQQTGVEDYFNPVTVPTTLSSCTEAYQNPPVALTWCSMRLDGFNCRFLRVYMSDGYEPYEVGWSLVQNLCHVHDLLQSPRMRSDQGLELSTPLEDAGI
ncbi:hypothetical protein PSTG_17510 [Puccinia striiformis f. sp. tritici PST-78]|uniref:Uncharacterized protein n=1 Tax=Puccinia striiformis f. sp. tritici PST-78 TaxID=1165861 RepID=A0A0L0UPT8_9BASI|nr:hypothetical protein PSTG_17510 [Puccinia striiformis f. sp. tritici PST-78]